jgi:phosphoglycolate phosphatase
MRSSIDTSTADWRFRAFVFDLDGTLTDSRPAIEKAAQMAIDRVAPSYSGRHVTAAIGPPIRQMFASVLQVTEPELLDALVATFREVYDSDVCRETPAYPGVSELLARIANGGASSFVLTNKPIVPTRLILSSLGLESLVREIVTPDSAHQPFLSKTKALAALLDRHGLSPARTVMVGDSADDAVAAEACGVAFAAALYGYGNLSAEAPVKNWLTIETPTDMILFLG